MSSVASSPSPTGLKFEEVPPCLDQGGLLGLEWDPAEPAALALLLPHHIKYWDTLSSKPPRWFSLRLSLSPLPHLQAPSHISPSSSTHLPLHLFAFISSTRQFLFTFRSSPTVYLSSFPMPSTSESSVFSLTTLSSALSSLAVHPQATSYICGLNSGDVSLLTLPSSHSVDATAPLCSKPLHSGPVSALHIQSSLLLSASDDRTVKVSSLPSLQPLRVFFTERMTISQLLLIPPSSSSSLMSHCLAGSLWAGGESGAIYVWHIESDSLDTILSHSHSPVTSLSASPSTDRQVVVAARQDGCLHIYQHSSVGVKLVGQHHLVDAAGAQVSGSRAAFNSLQDSARFGHLVAVSSSGETKIWGSNPSSVSHPPSSTSHSEFVSSSPPKVSAFVTSISEPVSCSPLTPEVSSSPSPNLEVLPDTSESIIGSVAFQFLPADSRQDDVAPRSQFPPTVTSSDISDSSDEEEHPQRPPLPTPFPVHSVLMPSSQDLIVCGLRGVTEVKEKLKLLKSKNTPQFNVPLPPMSIAESPSLNSSQPNPSSQLGLPEVNSGISLQRHVENLKHQLSCTTSSSESSDMQSLISPAHEIQSSSRYHDLPSLKVDKVLAVQKLAKMQLDSNWLDQQRCNQPQIQSLFLPYLEPRFVNVGSLEPILLPNFHDENELFSSLDHFHLF
eukprot:GILI01026106.1.p1 GENE.GILI01026106.1~~GILI01026106.1.p1  ORF type:complete len:670 (+),score=58.77 GILI01026106.1:49-2058(+)